MTLTAIIVFQYSSEVPAIRFFSACPQMPALSTRMSIPCGPSRRGRPCPGRSARDVTSVSTNVRQTTRVGDELGRLRPRTVSMSTTTTVAPAPARAFAYARPMPWPAPVTIATFSDRSTISRSSSAWRAGAQGRQPMSMYTFLLRHELPDAFRPSLATEAAPLVPAEGRVRGHRREAVHPDPPRLERAGDAVRPFQVVGRARRRRGRSRCRWRSRSPPLRPRSVSTDSTGPNTSSWARLDSGGTRRRRSAR